MDKYSKRAIQVAGGYALFGILWIVFSDQILAGLVGDAAQLTYVQTLKGLAYVFCTAALVFALTRRVLDEQDRLYDQVNRSETRFQSTFEQSAVGIAHVGKDGAWLRVNQKLCQLFGYTREELVGHNFRDITYPEDQAASEENVARLLRGEAPSFSMEERFLHKNGAIVWARVTFTVMYHPDGVEDHFVAVIEDISAKKCVEEERQRLEAALLQSQKMEAVGRLAGGVAHDFNNMLSVISGYTEIAMSHCADDDPIVGDLRQVALAAERSAALTRQLLAFARRDRVRPRAVNLNVVIAESEKLLTRMVGSSIELRIKPSDDLWQVHMDPSQVDQILANLAVNSRDAITGSGWIEIHTENVVLDEAACAGHPGAVPGDFVRLGFEDSGCGMAPEVIQHLFEPFFTTKEKGKGTGLGLATVFGIVEQNQGLITVKSSPGDGASFSIFVPRFSGALPVPQERTVPAAGGSETIMLVEDEQPILSLLRRAITQRGYRVLGFSDPREALQAIKDGAAVDLVVTDVLMPQMNGAELGRQIHQLLPEIKMIYMSGHTDTVVLELGVSPGRDSFLQKPFVPGVLLDEIRRSLDADLPAPRSENT